MTVRGAIAIAVVTTLACRADDKRGAADTRAGSNATGQGLKEALTILCGRAEMPPDWSNLAPPDRQAAASTWLDARITNAEARALLAALADVDPNERANRVRRAARQADLPACEPLALFALTERPTDAFVPDVTPLAAGTALLDQDHVVVTVSPTAVVVEGRPVAPIVAGVVPDGDLAKVTEMLRTTGAQGQRSLAVVTLAVDRGTRFPLLARVVDAVRAAGTSAADLMVRASGETRVVRIELPKARTGGDAASVVVVEVSAQGAAGAGKALAAIRPGARVELAVLPAATAQAIVEVAAAAYAVKASTVAFHLAPPPPEPQPQKSR